MGTLSLASDFALMRYFLLLPFLLAGLADAGPTTITATGTLASEYVYRGISQSDNHLAPQGSVIISRDGWYGGLWASKADYDDKLTQYELDGFVGKGWKVDKLDLDLHVLKYDYPDTKSAWQYGNWRAALGAGYRVGDGRIGVYTDRYDNHLGSGHSHYYELNGMYPLGGYTFTAKLGRQHFADNVRMGLPNFTYTHFGVSRPWKGFNFTVAVDRSNISKDECFYGQEWCGTHLNMQVSRSFTLFQSKN